MEISATTPHIEHLKEKEDGRARILEITNCPMGLEGAFKCTSSTDETAANLRVMPLPDILEPLQDVSVPEGKTAVFSCKLSDPECPIDWVLNGEKVEANDKFSFTAEDGRQELTIQNCLKSDAGQVMFRITANFQLKASLTVTDAVDGEGDGDDTDGLGLGRRKGCPKILEGLERGVIKVGKAHTFVAELMGKPVPTKIWSFKAQELSNNDRINIVSEDFKTEITVSQALRKDTGMYKLRVENENGFDEAEVELVVLGKPGKPEGPLEVREIYADKCTLSWKPPIDDGGSPITEYEIEMLCPKTKQWKKIGRCKPDLPLKYPVTDLEEGQEYNFRVSAINEEGQSEPLEGDKPIKAKNPFGKILFSFC